MKFYNFPKVEKECNYENLAAGTLHTLMTLEDKDRVTILNLRDCYINGSDIKFIRSMGKLETLCFKGKSRLVKGGEAYFTKNGISYYTEDDIIGDYMFSDLSLSSVALPNSTIKIGDYAFYNCTYLTSVPSVSEIGNYAFSNCKWISTIYLQNTKVIGAYAFSGCMRLKLAYNLENIISIGEGAFQSTGLETFIVPNKVKEIKSLTFDGCHFLRAIILGTSVTNIASYAFRNCSNIQNIYIYSALLPYVQSNAMDSIKKESCFLHYILKNPFSSNIGLLDNRFFWESFKNVRDIFEKPSREDKIAVLQMLFDILYIPIVMGNGAVIGSPNSTLSQDEKVSLLYIGKEVLLLTDNEIREAISEVASFLAVSPGATLGVSNKNRSLISNLAPIYHTEINKLISFILTYNKRLENWRATYSTYEIFQTRELKVKQKTEEYLYTSKKLMLDSSYEMLSSSTFLRDKKFIIWES